MLGTLFILGACHKGEVKSRVCDVTINACVATPETAEVKDGGQLCWEAKDHDYKIRFKKPPGPTASFKVNRGHSSPGHVIKGKNSGCDPDGAGGYYCKYSLTKDNDPTSCADPGVHVTPP